ncbi:hypothetical protein [Botrimarina sp.]|uniref:hypothetical protein n=1 Tax=Botrimarina sp. TaxID=2795802 RepID=UPI0032EC1B25
MLRSLLALAAVAGVAATADAFPQFQKQFLIVYAGEDSNPDFAVVVKDAKCFVCHQGKKKTNRNPYGEALHEYIGKKDRKDDAKIQDALAKVAEQSSNPDDPAAPKFGDLIAEGKLPGGDLEQAQQEPEDLEEEE